MAKRLLVVGAHSADFVWRSAGTIAVVTSQGGSTTVVALSYGERGESGALWKEPNRTVEKVKRIGHEQASEAAGIVGASFLYVYEPSGNRFEIANAGARLILAPDWKPIIWSEAERKKGQAWGLPTLPSFH